jgi:membrane protease subunit HflC
MNKVSPVLVAVALAGVGIWVFCAALYTVTEGQQALVVRLGKPVGVTSEPGLNIKAPLIDTVIYYDKRLLPLKTQDEQIILGDQKRIVAGTYTHFRISDPLRFYQSVRTVEQARAQLGQIVSSSLRRALGQAVMHSLLSEERATLMNNVQNEVREKAKPLGIEVVEVRLQRADLPYETSQAIYERMKSERQREAKELRAQGFEWAQQIQSKAEAERTVIISEAQRQSRIVRGQAEADANRVFAEAFDKDPQFYKLYRTLQTYRQALADANPTLVLSPQAEFLRGFNAGPDLKAKP